MIERCLVSIITACYNGEKFIDQYMDSVLSQTCPSIELILVNDGSTDSSEEKIMSYKDKLQDRGIRFEYIYKQNGGQSSAFNAGLKHFHGKYLTWIDIDDVMHVDYIEIKTQYMEEHSKVDYLITPSAVVNIDNPQEVICYTWKIPPRSREDMLKRIISGKDYNYESGSFFIRAQILEKANPSKKIYDACGIWSGAQIQMMFPVIYHGNYGYLDKCLFDYYLHDGNDHNKYKTKSELVIKFSESYKTIINTIESVEMPLNEQEKYKRIAYVKIKKDEMSMAVQLHDADWYAHALKEIEEDAVFKDKLRLLVLKYSVLAFLHKLLKRILRKSR